MTRPNGAITYFLWDKDFQRDAECMDAHEHFPGATDDTSLQPLFDLQRAFAYRRLLTYQEGRTLVVNDPYLRERVDVTCNERWFCWWSPVGERRFAERDRPADAVDQIVQQYAGIYLQDRRSGR